MTLPYTRNYNWILNSDNINTESKKEEGSRAHLRVFCEVYQVGIKTQIRARVPRPPANRPQIVLRLPKTIQNFPLYSLVVKIKDDDVLGCDSGWLAGERCGGYTPGHVLFLPPPPTMPRWWLVSLFWCI